jgi:hypothetical protein
VNEIIWLSNLLYILQEEYKWPESSGMQAYKTDNIFPIDVLVIFRLILSNNII